VYWRRDGLGLAAGWYIVSWPPGAVPGRFNEEALFRGPFRQSEEAEGALRQVNSRAQVREARAVKAANPAPVAPARSSLEQSTAGGVLRRGPENHA